MGLPETTHFRGRGGLGVLWQEAGVVVLGGCFGASDLGLKELQLHDVDADGPEDAPRMLERAGVGACDNLRHLGGAARRADAHESWSRGVRLVRVHARPTPPTELPAS